MRKASIGFATLILGLAAVFGYAQAPVPFINQPLVPDAVAPGGPDFALTVDGTGFVSNSTVNWNTTPLVTTFISGSQLTAVVPAADIATASTGWVTVVNPAPGGGTSNVAFLSVRPSGGNSAQFSQGPSLAVGASPYAVAVGDFNGDGKLDLAVANYASNTVSILLGDGTGNFTPASSLAMGGFPQSLAVGDFNGDGILDLAVANDQYIPSCGTPGAASILLGDGKGNFTLASATAVGDCATSVAVGDFNGDGKLDLAVANSSSNTVSVLLGDGTGNSTLASSPATGYEPESVAVGDFNGDGKLDLVVTNYRDNTVSILLGDGTGNFSLASSPATGLYPYAVAVADFNGDGKLDLAVANCPSSPYGCFGYNPTMPPGTLSILLGDGTGNFTLASSPTVGRYPLSVAVGDFNGDGKVDLAVANSYESTVFILLGDGTSNFTLASSPPAGFDPFSVAVGDFNGDGKLDLAAADYSANTVSILLQAGPAATLYPASLSFGTQLLGTTSSPQNVTLTNTGAATLGITNIAASGNFGQTNTCGTSLAAGASCAITVTFTPLGVGTLTGAITITDNASNSPQTVSLRGVATEVGFVPATVSFGRQAVGAASAPRTITLLNRANRNLTIFGFAIRGSDPGDFAETNTCGTGVAPGASCTISVTFTPQAKGPRTATLEVLDNGGASPQTVSLKGIGQ